MSLGRLVPWAGWDEWRQVGSWLLFSDQHEVQQGIDRVAAWRSRGRLPLGVDVTASLVETQARDAALHPPLHPSSALPDSQLRLQYSMALVRMVNGIADSSQKGRVAASVASLAAAAGLPRILVDLRHESTHNELPSAASLRLAAAQALTWLGTHYWGRQEEHLGGCRLKVQELVQEYCSLQAAAAAKVASQKGVEPGDEAGEEARAGGAAAARAAAAAAAAGRKLSPQGRVARSAREAEGEGGSAGVEAGGDEDGGYSAAAGQRRRKALLAELKMGVRRPAAGLLTPAILAAGCSDAVLSAAEGDQPTLERSLAKALAHFVKEWPQLPALLLRDAVGGLTGCTAGTAGHVRSTPPLEWLAWVQRLLPQANPGSNAAAAAAAAAGDGRRLAQATGGLLKGWTPPVPLLRELVGMSLSALVQCTHSMCTARVAAEGASTGAGTALDPCAGGGGDGGRSDHHNCNSATAAAATALLCALHLLLDAWKAADAGASSAALTRCLASLAQALPVGVPESRGGKGPLPPRVPLKGGVQREQEPPWTSLRRDEDDMDVAEGGAASQAQQLDTAMQHLQELQSKRDRAGAGGSRPAQHAKRWRRAVNWVPCALGNLPSTSDTNGRIPSMDSLTAQHAQHTQSELLQDLTAGQELEQGAKGGGRVVGGGGQELAAAGGGAGPHNLLAMDGGVDAWVGASEEERGLLAEWPLQDTWQQAGLVMSDTENNDNVDSECVGSFSAQVVGDDGSCRWPAAPAAAVPPLRLLI